MVTVVDIASRQVLSEIPVGVEPEGMAVSHDGKWVVNTSETTNMAHFIDTDTHEITDNVLVDQRPALRRVDQRRRRGLGHAPRSAARSA